MIYNTANSIEAEQAEARVKWLISHAKKFEVREIRRSVSYPQMKYQHVLFKYYALETGYTEHEVKQYIYKQVICPDFFRYEKNGIEMFKSVKDLDTKQTTLALEAFRNRVLAGQGIKLPLPHENEFLQWCENEVNKYGNRQYI